MRKNHYAPRLLWISFGLTLMALMSVFFLVPKKIAAKFMQATSTPAPTPAPASPYSNPYYSWARSPDFHDLPELWSGYYTPLPVLPSLCADIKIVTETPVWIYRETVTLGSLNASDPSSHSDNFVSVERCRGAKTGSIQDDPATTVRLLTPMQREVRPYRDLRYSSPNRILFALPPLDSPVGSYTLKISDPSGTFTDTITVTAAPYIYFSKVATGKAVTTLAGAPASYRINYRGFEASDLLVNVYRLDLPVDFRQQAERQRQGERVQPIYHTLVKSWQVSTDANGEHLSQPVESTLGKSLEAGTYIIYVCYVDRCNFAPVLDSHYALWTNQYDTVISVTPYLGTVGLSDLFYTIFDVEPAE